MIPNIEQIIEDLLAGNVSKSQAVNWLNQHAENAHADLRDHFASLAVQGMLCEGYIPEQKVNYASYNGIFHEMYAEQAYKIADAMLKARQS